MSNRPKPSFVIFAKSVATMAEFYREVAGLTEVHGDKSHAVLDGGDYQLVIHGIPQKIAERIEITSPPQVREDTALKVCLPVDSIQQARSRAAKLGGKIGPKSKEWEARGFRACDGYDPEGNVFQVRESASE